VKPDDRASVPINSAEYRLELLKELKAAYWAGAVQLAPGNEIHASDADLECYCREAGGSDRMAEAIELHVLACPECAERGMTLLAEILAAKRLLRAGASSSQ
jgi:hypothetical protein